VDFRGFSGIQSTKMVVLWDEKWLVGGDWNMNDG